MIAVSKRRPVFARLLLLALCLAVPSLPAYGQSGELDTEGGAFVNGAAAGPGSTVASGSTVATSAGAYAVIDLGGAGWVELDEQTAITLTFAEMRITVNLEAGWVKISSSVGVASSIVTKDGSATAAGISTPATYSADLWCGNTYVTVEEGSVALRRGGIARLQAPGTSGQLGAVPAGVMCER